MSALASDLSEVIRGDHLSAGYPHRIVWKDGTFSAARGEFVAIIGPNGAGKTTLFRMLLGLRSPVTGSLCVLGERPRRGNPRIGYVPQRHAIDQETHLRAETLVHLGLTGTRWGPGTFSRGDREAVSSALEAVEVAALADRLLSSLSGGELQRVFLAEALVGGPELLLLDEPLSSLDLKRSRELVALVHRLVRSRRMTTLLVAHDINPMIRYLDQVIYIANGRVATGPPHAVLTSQRLTELYGMPVEVLRDSRGNLVIVGGEDVRGGEGA